jgi:hypothetical protein
VKACLPSTVPDTLIGHIDPVYSDIALSLEESQQRLSVIPARIMLNLEMVGELTEIGHFWSGL